MRAVLLLVLLLVVYQAVKILFRSAMAAYRSDGERASSIPGQEMVQDPRCRTYVVKGRATARRIGGRLLYFCSAACADAHERDHRST